MCSAEPEDTSAVHDPFACKGRRMASPNDNTTDVTGVNVREWQTCRFFGHVLTTASVADTSTRFPHHCPIVGPGSGGTGATQAEGRGPGWGCTPPPWMAATHPAMGAVHVHCECLDDWKNADTVELVTGHPPLQKRFPHLSTELPAHIRVRLHVYPLCLPTVASYGTASQPGTVSLASGGTQRPHHQRPSTEPLDHFAPE